MRLKRTISGISGVARNAQANVPLEVNRRYHSIVLLTALAGVATIASGVIAKIEVLVNEKSVWDISAAELLTYNTSIGLPDPTGQVTLNFSRPDLADIVNEEATAFDMFGERAFRLRVTMADVANVELNGESYYDFTPNRDAQGNPSKIVLRLNSFRESFPVGRKDWTTLDKTRPILRIMLSAGAAFPDNGVEVLADDLTVFEGSLAVNANMLGKYGIAAAGYRAPIAFNFTNRLDDGLLVSKGLNVRINNTTAQDVSALMETFSTGFDGRN
jgi:hypothetical protein